MDLEDLKLTVADLERYGPTLIIDQTSAGRDACPRLVAVTVPCSADRCRAPPRFSGLFPITNPASDLRFSPA